MFGIMRRSRYTPRLGAKICALVRAGETLAAIEARAGMPDRSTIHRWRGLHPSFGRTYQAALARRGMVRRRRRSDPSGERVPAPVYTQRLAEEICDLIVAGASLSEAARRSGSPPLPTLWLWLRQRPEFERAYVAACHLRDEALADQVVEIIDDCLLHGSPAEMRASLSAARQRIAACKWRLSMLRPKTARRRFPA